MKPNTVKTSTRKPIFGGLLAAIREILAEQRQLDQRVSRLQYRRLRRGNGS